MRFAAALTLLVLPLVATAQVYSWKDANGKMHYSDQPPPDRNVGSRRIGPSNSASDDVATATKAAADKRQDATKQATEAKDKAAQAERERADDALRQENCGRARQNLAGIEAGQIRFRMTASGEREALDGEARESELASARRAVDINCSPKPAAAKK